MRKGFTLIELMIVVAILSVLSVVAVPAFIKYMRRAKTAEAIDQLDKIHKSASAYFARGQVAAKSGQPIQCQFPGDTGLTPEISGKVCCGGTRDVDSDDRCDLDQSLWDTPEWAALNFQMQDQHYFGYEFKSTGVLADAKYTARAHADLDCDGELSTFERYGYGTPDSSYGHCAMESASAMYMHMETE